MIICGLHNLFGYNSLGKPERVSIKYTFGKKPLLSMLRKLQHEIN